MKKVIWIDIGTHFAQEHGSIFSSNFHFYMHICRRFLSGNVLGRGKSVKYQDIRNVISSRKSIRKRLQKFYSIFVEANPKIAYRKDLYLKADMIFNIALTDNTRPNFSITKLYLGNGDELSQGSSVFLEKGNVDKDTYIATLGVRVQDFFNELQLYLEEKFGTYDVLLRLNCEGIEDDVIYAAHSSFQDKLKLICGSLKDVEGVKGLEAYQRLNMFIDNNDLSFVSFYSGIESWTDAHAAIYTLLEENI